MPSGVVKWFDDEKGFGFIAVTDPAGPDVFAHYSEILGNGRRTTLSEGEKVEFEIDATGERGPRALRVQRLGHQPS